MESGTIKFFKTDAGYGFIQSDDGQEVFVHVSGCEEKIKKGDRVVFEIAPGKRGDNAVKVRLIED